MKHQWMYVTLRSAWGPCEHNLGGFCIGWGCEIGFGELTFFLDKQRVLCCDVEAMDDEFCHELLLEFYRRAREDARP